ncbi:hypothetical protein Hanom_Chr03g00243271 [Helianthus anomalus]
MEERLRGWPMKVDGGATLCYACGCWFMFMGLYTHVVLNPHCCFKVAISFK